MTCTPQQSAELFGLIAGVPLNPAHVFKLEMLLKLCYESGFDKGQQTAIQERERDNDSVPRNTPELK